MAIDGTPILESDQDVLLLGDYNTMGREEAPPISAREELDALDRELTPGFSRLPIQPNCTEYSTRRAGVLDHIVASVGMQEIAATVRVTGYCAVERCAEITGPMPAAHERLSDHCPVVVEVQDQDLD
jgi:predicted extracellular nuclease